MHCRSLNSRMVYNGVQAYWGDILHFGGCIETKLYIYLAVCRLYNLIPHFICLVHFGPISSNAYKLCSFCPFLRGTYLHFRQLEQFCSSTSAGANSSCNPKLDRKTCGILYQHFLAIKLWTKSTDSFAHRFSTKNLIR